MGPLWPASGRDLRGLMVGTVVISVDPGDGGLSELCWLDHMWAYDLLWCWRHGVRFELLLGDLDDSLFLWWR